MINWEVVIGLTIFCLILVGIWEIASALWEINHEMKDK
jgi:hypothetical protein